MITGRTRVFGILADPIAQVRVPEVFNRLFAEKGIDAVFVPFHIGADALEASWPAFRAMKNLGGLIITTPHKQQVARLSDVREDEGEMIGAVNTVRREPDGRFVATMFDGEGFVSGLRAQGHDPRGRRVVMAGAGGAGSAIAFALAKAGVAHLVIVNRSPEKARALADRVRGWFPDCPIEVADRPAGDIDILVNTTSLGMKPEDPLPVPLDALRPDTLVAEIIMKPEMTPLLQAAEKRRNPIHHGRHMLDEQIRLMCDFLRI